MTDFSSHQRRSSSSGLFAGILLLGGLGLFIAGLILMITSSDRAETVSVSSGPSTIAVDSSSTVAGAAAETADEQAQPAATDSSVDEQPQERMIQSAPAEAPNPVGIRIPTINVDASMIPLGLQEDRSIEVPTDFAQTGWWKDGPEPGEIGPAVVLGHVDSRSGPAVFFDLRSLEPGDEIVIDREDGSTVTYQVQRIEQHPKDDFPTDDVYGDTPAPELRLVTCGGDFNRSVRSYLDNVIVFATLV